MIFIGLTYDGFLSCLLRIALKRRKFFSGFESGQILKVENNENLEILAKKLNYYEITVDRAKLDEYEYFSENEKDLDYLEGLMKFLGVKQENENNLEELKKFLNNRWKIFKEKKKSQRREGII